MGAWVGRSSEAGHLHRNLDSPLASAHFVSGLSGVGKSALVARVVADYRAATATCAPLPDAILFREAAQALGHSRALHAAMEEDEPTDWSGLFRQCLECASPGGPPLVVVLDDAHRLSQARSHFETALADTLVRARAEERTLHVVLVGLDPGGSSSELLGEVSAPGLVVPPLPFRAASPLLPGRSPRDRLRAYSVFGGLPGVLEHVDPSTSLASNVRGLLLGKGAALGDRAGAWVESRVQNPARYFAILQAMADGERSWGGIREGVPSLSSSGQIAPYLNKLESMHFVQGRASLDAAPRSRSRRYRLTDPFLAFWLRFVMPLAFRTTPADPATVWKQINPDLDAHVRSVFPEVCRTFMASDAIEVFGANAREAGSLWGDEVDIPVAGVLASGAAFYGHCAWNPLPGDANPFERLDTEMRETRFGFGRQHRLRLLFTGHSLPRPLQRAVARRIDAYPIGVAALMGSGD